MNKSELIAKVAIETGIKRAEVKRVFDAITNNISNVLLNGDMLAISGFGNYYVGLHKTDENGNLVFIPKFRYSKSFIKKISMQIN